MRKIPKKNAENKTNLTAEPPKQKLVTAQPETLLLNKYLGFKQLAYIQEKGISCVIPTEIENCEETVLSNYPDDTLLTIRIATITGRDFDLPSIIGVNKTSALNWIAKQRLYNKNFIFFCSEYFAPIITGRIHLEYFNTKIEMSLGDFSSFKHGIPDLSISSDFNQLFERKAYNHPIDDYFIEKTISLSKKLKHLYKNEFKSDINLLHEYDFAFIQNIDKIDLKIIGMRTYIDNDSIYSELSPSLLNVLIDFYSDTLFEDV